MTRSITRVELEQLGDRLPVGGRQHRHGRRRQAGLLQREGGEARERRARVEGLRAAAQDDGVAGLDAQPRRVARHVRARLVDDRDDAERHAHPADAQPVRAHGHPGDLADRVGQRGDLAQPLGDGREPLRVEPQPVLHRRREPAPLRLGEVPGVRLEHRAAFGFQPARVGEQRRVLRAGGRPGDAPGGRLRGCCQFEHALSLRHAIASRVTASRRCPLPPSRPVRPGAPPRPRGGSPGSARARSSVP